MPGRGTPARVDFSLLCEVLPLLCQQREPEGREVKGVQREKETPSPWGQELEVSAAPLPLFEMEGDWPPRSGEEGTQTAGPEGYKTQHCQ